MKIIKWLEESQLVSEFSVLEYKTFENGFYIYIKSTLKDNSNLFIREYSDSTERNYSYHWQSSGGKLICRWDNAPHHPGLYNFPHHKHFGKKVDPSNEMTLHDVLKFIASYNVK